MRVRPALAVLALAALAGVVSPSAALAADGGRPLSTVMSGADEPGPGDPDGAGSASLRLNPGQGRICFSSWRSRTSRRPPRHTSTSARPAYAGPSWWA